MKKFIVVFMFVCISITSYITISASYRMFSEMFETRHFYKKESANAVYLVGQRSYYVASIQEDNQVIMNFISKYPGAPVNLIADVQENNQSWYECDLYYNNFYGYESGKCEIHIKKDMNNVLGLKTDEKYPKPISKIE